LVAGSSPARPTYIGVAIELAAAAFADGAKVGLRTELRCREKTMNTTWKAGHVVVQRISVM
jgi:hypothetical protein